MNGKSHVVIGAAAAGSSAAFGVDPGQCAVLAVISAGASLLPDLDHPNATATSVLGRPLHKGVRLLSATARRTASTGLDVRDARMRQLAGRDPDHRGLTHTAVSALVAGTAVGLLCTPWTEASVFLAVVMALLAVRPFTGSWRRLTRGGRKVRKVLLPVGAAAGAAVLAGTFPVTGVMAGAAVAAGWLSHILADGCTKDGVPLLWPVPYRGKRWWRFRFLGTVLSSGGRAEWLAVAALSTLLALPATRFI